MMNTMNGNYTTSQLYTSPPSPQLHLYGAQPTGFGASAPGTPAMASPQSPRTPELPLPLPLQTRQLRPMKSPLYVPAVLRPTERPRGGQLTPPRSMSNSFDSSRSDDDSTKSRRGTFDSPNKTILGRVLEDRFLDDAGYGKVTGYPTRDHWKPDASSTTCDAATCTKPFSFFGRRHHCRRCGNIFCSTHVTYAVPLDQYARFHPHGIRSRACEHCWSDYKVWETERCSRSNSVSSDGSACTPTTPTMAIGRTPTNRTLPGALGADMKVGSAAAASVPKDWNWSTF